MDSKKGFYKGGWVVKRAAAETRSRYLKTKTALVRYVKPYKSIRQKTTKVVTSYSNFDSTPSAWAYLAYSGRGGFAKTPISPN